MALWKHIVNASQRVSYSRMVGKTGELAVEVTSVAALGALLPITATRY